MNASKAADNNLSVLNNGKNLLIDEALNAEVGEAEGFVHEAFRKWCIAQPDLV